jgi:hypothetical protein
LDNQDENLTVARRETKYWMSQTNLSKTPWLSPLDRL